MVVRALMFTCNTSIALEEWVQRKPRSGCKKCIYCKRQSHRRLFIPYFSSEYSVPKGVRFTVCAWYDEGDVNWYSERYFDSTIGLARVSTIECGW